MKNRYLAPVGMFLILLLVLTAVPVSVQAYEGSSLFVDDSYGMLSEAQEKKLETEMQRILDIYEFQSVLLISKDVFGDERNYAASYMQENEIGYGEEKSGMCIFHQPDKRNITIVFRGPYQNDFTVKVQDAMLDCAVEKLLDEDPYGAYEVLLKTAENGLKRLAAGKEIRPMDADGRGFGRFLAACAGISFLLSAVVVAIMTLVQNVRMKTRTPQENADLYVQGNGAVFSQHRDIYMRCKTVRQKVEKENSGGSSSGSFRSGGESFSGSSRDY